MEEIISTSRAGNTLLLIFGFLFIFHWLVLFGIIPFDIIWAGKIKDKDDLVKMEFISLLVLVVAAIIVALKIGYVNYFVKPTITKVGIWVLFVFFILNTIGNLTAKNPIEKYGFGLLTFVMSLLIFRLAIAHKN